MIDSYLHCVDGYLEYALPILLLALAFTIKMVVDRSTTISVVFSSALELPVDVAFLAMSFLIAFCITTVKDELASGLVFLLIYIIATIFIVVFWRKSIKLYEEKRLITCGMLGILNISLSIFGTYISILLILGTKNV